MKKYKLLKEFPWAKVGNIYDENWRGYNCNNHDMIKEWIFDNESFNDLLWEWIEEIKEEENPKYRIWDYVVAEKGDDEITIQYLKISGIILKYWQLRYDGYKEEDLRLPTEEELEIYFR